MEQPRCAPSMYNTRMPAKVAARANENGLHATCVNAGPRGTCTRCVGVMQEAFNHFYGQYDQPLPYIKADLALEGR